MKDTSPAARAAVYLTSTGDALPLARASGAHVGFPRLLASVPPSACPDHAITTSCSPDERMPDPVIAVWAVSWGGGRSGAPCRLHLVLIGELDAYAADRLRRPMRSLVGSGRAVWVDLSQIGFIDSAGLRLLESLRAELEAHGQRVSFHHPSRAVRRFLQLAGGASSLPIGVTSPWSDSRDRAVAAIADGWCTGLGDAKGGRDGTDRSFRSGPTP